jgi:hypothetical protein
MKILKKYIGKNMNKHKISHQFAALLASLSFVFFASSQTLQAQNIDSSTKKNDNIYLRESLLKKYMSGKMSVVYKTSEKRLITSEKEPASDTVRNSNKLRKIELRSAQNAVSRSVKISAGGLYYTLTASELSMVTDLTISGSIDARDFKIMRDNMPNLQVVDISESVINAYSGEKGTDSYEVNYSANTIPNLAFSGCYELITVKLSSTVDTIGSEAFDRCFNLKTCLIPSSSTLRCISYGAFEFCEELESINFPHTLTYIGDWGFWCCKNLRTFNIPSSVLTIGNLAFYESGIYITINADNPNYSSNDGVLYDKNKSILIYYPTSKSGDFIIPASVRVIATAAFYNCDKIRAIDIPASVRRIDISAFTSCDSLQYAKISADTIGGYAFENCDLLKDVTLTNNIKLIGYSAFEFCKSLDSIIIPANVSIIGEEAFNCTGLVSASIAADTICLLAFEGCSKLKKINLATNVSVIFPGAFARCNSLDSILIPSSVKIIGDGAFTSCKGPFGVSEDNPYYSSVDGVLYDKKMKRLIQCTAFKKNLTIPSTVKSIGIAAFYGCDSLRSVSIPESVNSIGIGAFFNCNHLEHVSISNGIKNLPPGTFIDCKNLRSITLGTSLDSINFSAFNKCAGLDTIFISSTKPPLFKVFKDQDEINGYLDNTYGDIYLHSVETYNNFNYCEHYLASYFTEYDIIRKSLGVYDNEWAEKDGWGDDIGDAWGHWDRLSPFYGVDTTACTIVVPQKSLESYRSAGQWRNFKNIITMKEFSTSVDSVTIAGTGGSAAVAVNTDAKWAASTDQDWLKVSPSAVNGKDSLVITATINPTINPRKGIITINAEGVGDHIITVIQNAGESYLSVSETTINFSVKGSSKSIIIYSNAPWTISTNNSWFTVKPLSGNGTDTVSIITEANPDTNARTGFLSINGTTLIINDIIVTQAGKKQITITKPTVTTNKIYDGTTTAFITNIGSLQDVNIEDISTLGVEASAKYEDANAGKGKNVTVQYVLTGSSKDYYVIPDIYLITDGEIVPKQINITEPKVITEKVYDGTTTAEISDIGIISGILPVDSGKVTVTATANYDNADAGTGKTIKVVYSISGFSAGNYFAPADFLVSDAKINKEVKIKISGAPSAGCEGSNVELSYSVLEGSPTQYQIIFDSDALSAGLKNISYVNLPTNSGTGIITIPVPENTHDGTYSASLQVRDNSKTESQIYNFQFTINLSSNYIIEKFDDIVLCDNSSGRFTTYQWYKNGIVIEGATKQYYVDSEGLVGSYFVEVTTTDGRKLTSCSKTLNIPLKTANKISVYPNPIGSNKSCTIKISGLSEEELKGAVISIYDMNGNQALRSDNITSVNSFNFSKSDGAYIGNITTIDGKKLNFRIIVEN